MSFSGLSEQFFTLLRYKGLGLYIKINYWVMRGTEVILGFVVNG